MTDADVAIEVVAAGADVVRRSYGRDLARTAKGGGDFATSADIEAEAAMLAVLASKRPADGILAEESGSHAGSDGGSRVWLIDPLCGTLNYAARMPIVAVNATVRDGGSAPCRRGRRPLQRRDVLDRRPGEPCPRRRARLAARADRGVAAGRSQPRPAVPERPRLPGGGAGRGPALRGRVQAAGDGAPRDSVQFAAGIAICKAAGCVVTDLFGDPPGGGPTGLLTAADSETHATLGMTRAVGSPS
ncbi:MAG TPA: inositol monophosphatase family protein [Gaiellales bacterium]|nr:inositol monophosphatase family protein [Gaiellales bacterium]